MVNEVKVFSSPYSAKEGIKVKFTAESNKSEMCMVISRQSTNRVIEDA